MGGGGAGFAFASPSTSPFAIRDSTFGISFVVGFGRIALDWAVPAAAFGFPSSFFTYTVVFSLQP